MRKKTAQKKISFSLINSHPAPLLFFFGVIALVLTVLLRTISALIFPPSSPSSPKTQLVHLIKPKTNKIAFISNGNIWVVNPDGTDLTQLTNINYHLKAPTKLAVDFKNTFFSTLSLSPDGSHLAASALSDTVRNVIQHGNIVEKSKYVINDFWDPPHLDLYVFDLIEKKNTLIHLEDYGLSAQNTSQILGIQWLPDNQHVYIKIQNRRNIIINIYHPLETIRDVISPLDKGSVKNNLFMAYIPEISSIYFDNIFSASATNTEIGTINLENNPSSFNIVYALPGEKQESYIIPGADSMIYFHTVKNQQVRLHQYNVVTNKNTVILEMPSCYYQKNKSTELCINLPAVHNGLETYNDQFISPHGKYIVASFNKKNVYQDLGIYRLSDLKQVYPQNNSLSAFFKWSLDGESILSSSNNHLIITNLQTGKETIVTPKLVDITSMDMSYDWNYLF